MAKAWIYPAGPLGDTARHKYSPEAFGVTSWALFKASPQQPGYSYPKVGEAVAGTLAEWEASGDYPTEAQIETGDTFVRTLIDAPGGPFVVYKTPAALAAAAKAANVYTSIPGGGSTTPPASEPPPPDAEVFLSSPAPAGLGWVALLGIAGLGWWLYDRGHL